MTLAKFSERLRWKDVMQFFIHFEPMMLSIACLDVPHELFSRDERDEGCCVNLLCCDVFDFRVALDIVMIAIHRAYNGGLWNRTC